MTDTQSLDRGDARLVYDIDGPLPPSDGRKPLVMIGQPMASSGFATLQGLLPDRTTVRYDPRGLGRSERSDGTDSQDPATQAADVHAVIEAVGGGPVDLFASSGGAITALALVATYPDDVAVLVAHEPPLINVLPDAAAAHRALQAVQDTYTAKGFGHGMAAFVALTNWQGEYTEAYFDKPAPDPLAFGMPTDDDGTRNDPLLSDASRAITEYELDVAALVAAPTRIVIAVGEESAGVYTGRTSTQTARLLGQEPTVFPSHHGGFMGGEFGWAGQPEAFAAKLRHVLEG